MLQINLKFQETDQGHIFDAWESLSDIERDLAAAAGPRLQPLPNQPYKNLVLLPDKIISDEIKVEPFDDNLIEKKLSWQPKDFLGSGWKLSRSRRNRSSN